jgi:hypothetical protein
MLCYPSRIAACQRPACRFQSLSKPMKIRSLLFSGICFILAGAAQAAVTEWSFAKAIGGEQTATDTAPSREFAELLARVATEDAGDAASVTLSGGPGGARNFTQDGRVWYLVLEFDDEAALDAAFPSETTYTITLSGGSLGTLTQEVALGPKAYPEATPYFKGSTFADMDSVDPESDFTVAFNNPGTSADLTFFQAEADFSGGSAEDDWLASGDGSKTSFLIPADTLLADKPYIGVLFFGKGQTVSGAGGLGAEGTVSHAVFVEAPLDTASATANAVSIPDENLLAAIREALRKPTGDITAGDLLSLTDLDARNSGISDLTGMEKAANLRNLILGSNQISDLSSLANLTSLMSLWLDSNQISDLSSLDNLTSLTSLTRLYLQNNQISDLSSLANLTSLTSLEHLDLDSNQISDLSSLDNLTSLTKLYLQNNQISDLPSLVNLTSLRYLDLDNNLISDLSPLADLIWRIRLHGLFIWTDD